MKWKKKTAMLLAITLTLSSLSVPATPVYATQTSVMQEEVLDVQHAACTEVVYKTVVDTGVDGDARYKSVALLQDGAGQNVSSMKVALTSENPLGVVSTVANADTLYKLIDGVYSVYNSSLTEITDATLLDSDNKSAFNTLNGLSGWDSENDCPVLYYIYNMPDEGSKYEVTFGSLGCGSVDVDAVEVSYGSTLTFPTNGITPNEGYELSTWRLFDGTEVTKDTVFDFGLKNITVSAEFEKISRTIVVKYFDGYEMEYTVDMDSDFDLLYEIWQNHAVRENYKLVKIVNEDGDEVTAENFSYKEDATYTAVYEPLLTYHTVSYWIDNNIEQTTLSTMTIVDISFDAGENDSNIEHARTFDFTNEDLTKRTRFVADGKEWLLLSRTASNVYRAMYVGDVNKNDTGVDIINSCYTEENEDNTTSYYVSLDNNAWTCDWNDKVITANNVKIVSPVVISNGIATIVPDKLKSVNKKGYSFDGWSTDTSGTTIVTGMQDFSSTNVVLYANFTPITYTVSLDVNGGSFEEETVTMYTYNVKDGFDGLGEALTLPIPTLEHYEFDGWVGIDDDGKEYQVASIYSATSYQDYNLKASWKPIQYRIVYDLDGGVIKDAPQYHIYGESDLVIPIPTKTGYVFEDWYVDSTLSTKLEDIGSYTKPVTLYAKWQARSFSISYELNGGVGNIYNPKNYVMGKEPLIYNPSRVHYSFAGWYLDKEFNNPMTEAAFISGEDIVLYAKWLGDKYSIQYNFNHAPAISEPSYYRVGSAPTLVDPVRKGYIFTGWYFDEACTNKATETSNEWSNASNVKLYAGWKAYWYKLSYKLNGGSIKTAPQSFAYEVPADIPNPKRKGYLFLGWCTDTKCKTKLTNASYNNASDMTLYAKWQKCKPGKSKVVKLKSKSKNKLEVKIKKQNKIDGYQIRYATNKDFKKAKKKYTDSTLVTLKKLKSGQVYYVQVRTYIVDSSNKMVYSKWSKIKTVRVK